MEAELILRMPDGTTKTIQLAQVSVSTTLSMTSPLPNEPGAPVVPVTILHLHAEVTSGGL